MLKYYLKELMTVLTCAVLITACTKNYNAEDIESIDENDTVNADETIGLASINNLVEAAPQNYAIELFSDNSNGSNSEFPDDVLELSVNIESMEYIDLMDIDADMLALEAKTKFDGVLSKISLLIVNNETVTVVSHFKTDNFNGPNGEYNGWQFFTNVQGIILEAYLYQQGLIIAKADKKDLFSQRNQNNKASKGKSVYGSRMPDPTPCWGIACGITLDEVVLPWTVPNGTGIVNIRQRRTQWTVGLNPNNTWTGYAAGFMTYLEFQNQQKAWKEYDEIVIEAGPGDEIKNTKKYTKCFKANSKAEITIYIDQPKANSSETWVDDDPSLLGTDINVGHTFVAITQGKITRVFGFYPKTGVSPSRPSTRSVLMDDSGHEYDVSITRTVSGNQLASILKIVNNFSKTYHLNSYNCTDFGVACGNAAGMRLPGSYGKWPLGGGDNPGVLGEKVRNLRKSNGRINKKSGHAKSNKGGC